MWYFFTSVMLVLHSFVGFVLIGIILLQRGRGGGLAGAFGGMGGQSAFGTKAGDVFTKITIYLATAWIVLGGVCVLMASSSRDTRVQGLAAESVEDSDKKGGAGKEKSDEKDDAADVVPGPAPAKSSDEKADAKDEPKDDAKKDDAKKDDGTKAGTGNDVKTEDKSEGKDAPAKPAVPPLKDDADKSVEPAKKDAESPAKEPVDKPTEKKPE